MVDVQGHLVFGFDFDFRLHKLTFSYERSRAQLAPTEETIHRYKVNV